MLDEVLEDAHALVVRLLEPGDGVEQLLDLGLELDHVLVDAETTAAIGCEGGCGNEKQDGGQAKRAVDGHGGHRGLKSSFSVLAINGELGAAVLLPAGLVGFGAELLFLAVADDADAGGGDAGVDEGGLGGVGAVFAEGEVVLGGAALVGSSRR